MPDEPQGEREFDQTTELLVGEIHQVIAAVHLGNDLGRQLINAVDILQVDFLRTIAAVLPGAARHRDAKLIILRQGRSALPTRSLGGDAILANRNVLLTHDRRRPRIRLYIAFVIVERQLLAEMRDEAGQHRSDAHRDLARRVMARIKPLRAVSSQSSHHSEGNRAGSGHRRRCGTAPRPFDFRRGP